jgi:predicted MFS family arabinose efflux permease
MMSARAMLPAWSEIFKLNIQDEKRGIVFSQGSTINYLSNIVLPLLIAPIMDYYPPSWKWIFFILAFLQLFDVLILTKLSVNLENYRSEKTPSEPAPLLIEPWKNSWRLIKERPDFRNYQIVFMLGGTGLILAHPVLPLFFNQVLHLSYQQFAFAVSVCKGIGFALTSRVWAKWFNRISIHLFNFFVTAFAGLFAVIIMSIDQSLVWIYIAYLIYGVMQAGSELSWNLAGPRFAREQDSTLFTSVNVAMVGLRGCIAPFLGEFIFLSSNYTTVFLISAGFCFAGAFYSYLLDYRERKAMGILKFIN